MWSFWLIAAGIFFIIEIFTTGFLIFWLGIGALIAMLASLFTSNLVIQTCIFVVSSAILIPFTRIFSNKFKAKDNNPTNAYSLIGKEGIVTIEINSDKAQGQVKVNGEIWSAKSDEIIPIDSKISVVKIEGVKLVVAPI